MDTIKSNWIRTTKFYKQSDRILKDIMDLNDAPVALFGKKACEDYLRQAVKFAEADENFALSPYATQEEREQYYE